MAKKVCYVVCSNDGCEQSTYFSTLKQAKKEMQDIISEDKKEFGLDEGDINYYITKITKTDEGVFYEDMCK